METLITQMMNTGIIETVKFTVNKILSSISFKGAEDSIEIIEQFNLDEVRDNYIEKHVFNVLRMRTIHKQEHDILLDDIYFPLKIKNAENNDELIVDDEFTLLHPRVLNIVGIAGQGKSTILRKLFQNELRLRKRIPFFLELRRIEKESLLDFFKSALEILGIDIKRSDNHVELLLQSGNIVLMLDGFDEVKANSRSEILYQIKELNLRFNCPIIVTSRPETEICREVSINNLMVKDLDEESQLGILKVLSEEREFDELAGIIAGNVQLKETLKTPILINLLYVCYPYWDELPSNIVEFYNKLYITLYLKHDRLKCWARERKSKLETVDSLWCFSALCFFSIQDEVFEFDTASLAYYANKALKAADVDNKQCEFFLDDLINITCLIQQDGLDRYVFLHKSVQEYHAAYAISTLPGGMKSNFYDFVTRTISNNDKFDNVLNFLRFIDEDSFQSCMVIKYFDKLELESVVKNSLDYVCEYLAKKINGLGMYAEKTDDNNVSWEAVEVISPEIEIDVLNLIRYGSRFSDRVLDDLILNAANSDFEISELENYDYSYVVNILDEKKSVTRYRVTLSSFIIYHDLSLKIAARLKEIASSYYYSVYIPLVTDKNRKSLALRDAFEIKRDV